MSSVFRAFWRIVAYNCLNDRSLTVLKDLQKEADQPGLRGIGNPGLSALIKELIKTAWGQIAAAGRVLLIVGLALLGANVTST